MECALARLRCRLANEPETDLVVLGAAYGLGLATNHACSDGNKRVAFVSMFAFLGVDGLEINPAEPEVVDVTRKVAAGRLGGGTIATWLHEPVVPFID